MFDVYHHPPLRRYESFSHPVCRFLVRGLCNSNGRSKSDFHVDLVLSVDGLLTLVKSVYGILNKQFGTFETYRGLHWRLHFHGEVYKFSDPEIHHFDLLHNPLRNGQTGWFEGSTASFRFSIVNINAEEICPSKLAQYPKINVIISPRVFTPDMNADWLSDETKLRAKDYHFRFKEYMNGANVWNRDASGEYYRDRPKASKWTEQEDDIISLLIRSGHKFQESWNNILQYCLLNRSEVGTSQQWYKLRKKLSLDSSSDDSECSSRGDVIIEAKRLSSKLLESYLKKGVPELGEHPAVRKRSIVVDETDENDIASPSKRRRVSFAVEKSSLGNQI